MESRLHALFFGNRETDRQRERRTPEQPPGGKAARKRARDRMRKVRARARARRPGCLREVLAPYEKGELRVPIRV